MVYAQALTMGLMIAWAMGQAYYPIVLRGADGADEKPAPPPAEPERDPGWCHSHGVHRDDEEE